MPSAPATTPFTNETGVLQIGQGDLTLTGTAVGGP
jgi:hypothetical protein